MIRRSSLSNLIVSDCYIYSSSAGRLFSISPLLLGLLFLCCFSYSGHCKLGPTISSQSSKDRGAQYFAKVTEEWHKKLCVQLDEKVHSLQQRSSSGIGLGSKTATDAGDKTAMEALYTATNGKYWANSTNWMNGDPCNDAWHGLYCLSGRVLQINLVNNNMTGSLPAKLAEADMLQVVRLYNNFLSGPIPQEILEMNSLQILDLNTNMLTGPFPSSISMANLTDLIFYNNLIKGTFPDLVATPLLETLEISTNIFLGNLPDMSRCPKLQTVIASFNNFTGQYPENVANLQSLATLWLFNNLFDNPKIPNTWADLVSLTDLQLDRTSGMLPSYIGQTWTKLVHLVIINGHLTGEFNTGLCDLQQLQDLRLFGNQLSGELPTCVCELANVQTFEMSDNQLTGSIPYCMGSVSQLATFYLSRNNLTGTLPVSIGSLANLQIMDVSSNALTGTVPASYAGLTEIVGFALCYNKLYKLETGLAPLYDRIKGYSCELYNNPWSCPLPSNVPANCRATCSQCNTGSKHTQCSDCVADRDCGWCDEGPNCLQGTKSGPFDAYCKSQDWTYGSGSC